MRSTAGVDSRVLTVTAATVALLAFAWWRSPASPRSVDEHVVAGALGDRQGVPLAVDAFVAVLRRRSEVSDAYVSSDGQRLVVSVPPSEKPWGQYAAALCRAAVRSGAISIRDVVVVDRDAVAAKRSARVELGSARCRAR